LRKLLGYEASHLGCERLHGGSLRWLSKPNDPVDPGRSNFVGDTLTPGHDRNQLARPYAAELDQSADGRIVSDDDPRVD
jgi:hypothetical protein